MNRPRNGHTNLSLGNLTNPDSAEQQLGSAFELLRDLMDWCLHLPSLPQTTQEMINDFRRKSDSVETLNWLQGKLEVECRKTSKLTWDSRIGVLAVTMGTEWSLLAILLTLFVWIVLSQVGYFPIWKIGWALLATLAMCFVIGMWTRGGPVFQFLGIEVRNRNGQLAPGWRCGVRMALAWLPFCVLIVCMPLLLEISFEQINARRFLSAEMSTENPDVVAKSMFWRSQVKEYPIQSMFVMFSTFVACLVMVVGFVFSIYSPERGLQDYIARTKLIP
jgi:hypothetical protein